MNRLLLRICSLERLPYVFRGTLCLLLIIKPAFGYAYTLIIDLVIVLTDVPKVNNA